MPENVHDLGITLSRNKGSCSLKSSSVHPGMILGISSKSTALFRFFYVFTNKNILSLLLSSNLGEIL